MVNPLVSTQLLAREFICEKNYSRPLMERAIPVKTGINWTFGAESSCVKLRGVKLSGSFYTSNPSSRTTMLSEKQKKSMISSVISQTSESLSVEEKKEETTSKQKKQETPSELKNEETSSELKKEETSSEQKKEEASSEQKKEEASSEQKKEEASSEQKKEEATSELKKEETSSEQKKEETTFEQKKEEITSEQKKEETSSITNKLETGVEIEEVLPTTVFDLKVDTSEMEQLAKKYYIEPDSKKKRSTRAERTKAAELKKKEEEERKALAEKQKEKCFTLELAKTIAAAKTNNVLEQAEDSTKLAEDFSRATCTFVEIGDRHMWKRLNFFLVMSRYVADKSAYLQDVHFPMDYKKHQFTASAYTVPAAFKKSGAKYENYERVHVSLLNKIAVEQGNELYIIKGRLKVLENDISLQHFFNICDIASSILNSVDAYGEFHLRKKAYTLLEEIRRDKTPYPSAAKIMAQDYEICLNDLQKSVENEREKANVSYSVQDLVRHEMKKMIANKDETLQYISGMSKAITRFKEHFDPKTPKNKNQSPLYEKID